MNMSKKCLNNAKLMAEKVTTALGGSGIWGVEFFICNNIVYFSELSPRPHDTGMVTLAGTQNFSQFELHSRAILGIPIVNILLLRNGASSVILAEKENKNFPEYTGFEDASSIPNTDFKIFGKPNSRRYRRMGVALSYGNENVETLVKKAMNVASKIKFD